MAFNVSSTIGDARPDLTQAYQEYDVSAVDFAFPVALPFAAVEKQAATIPVETIASTLRIENMERGAGGHYNRVDSDVGAVTYECKGRGLETSIPLGDGRLFQLPTLAQEQMAARVLKTKAMLWYENEMTDTVFTAANKAAAQTMTTAWDTVATANPLSDIGAACKTVREATGINPNTLILNARNWNYLLTAATTKGWFPGAVIITKDLIAQALDGMYGIRQIALSSAIQNTAAEGLAMVGASILPDDYVAVAYCAPGETAPYTEMACGRIFTWAEDGDPMYMEQYMWEPTRSIVQRVRANVDVKIWNNDLIKLIDVD